MDQRFFLCRTLAEQSSENRTPQSAQALLEHPEMNRCLQEGLIDIQSGLPVLTPRGKEFLAPYQVKNAIILAAGFGSRFVPLTFHTPKGLLPIRGERMIERQIKQLKANGIHNITVVVGYLRETFSFLEKEYGVKLVYNPEYAVKNNLATLYLVREELDNTYILSSDNWLSENMFHPYEPHSWYSSVFMKGETSEWCLETQGEDHRITGVTVGGKDAWVMYGPVYFSSAFSKAFVPMLEQAYAQPGSENNYWENVLAEHLEELPMYRNAQPDGQVYELENLEELREFDPVYRTCSQDHTMAFLSETLSVPEGEIHPVKCLSSGRMDHAFLFTARTKQLVYRCRKGAFAQTQVLPQIGSNHFPLFPWIGMQCRDNQTEEIYPVLTPAPLPNTPEQCKTLFSVLKTIHSFENLTQPVSLKTWLEPLWNALDHPQTLSFIQPYVSEVERLARWISSLSVPKIPVHGSFEPRFFYQDDQQNLVLDQWIYAGLGDPFLDLAAFAAGAQWEEAQTLQWLSLYLQREPSQEECLRMAAWGVLYSFRRLLEETYRNTVSEETNTNASDYESSLCHFLTMAQSFSH